MVLNVGRFAGSGVAIAPKRPTICKCVYVPKRPIGLHLSPRKPFFNATMTGTSPAPGAAVAIGSVEAEGGCARRLTGAEGFEGRILDKECLVAAAHRRIAGLLHECMEIHCQAF